MVVFPMTLRGVFLTIRAGIERIPADTYVPGINREDTPMIITLSV